MERYRCDEALLVRNELDADALNCVSNILWKQWRTLIACCILPRHMLIDLNGSVFEHLHVIFQDIPQLRPPSATVYCWSRMHATSPLLTVLESATRFHLP